MVWFSTTFAGSGSTTWVSDGPALSVGLQYPNAVTSAPSGAVYVATRYYIIRIHNQWASRVAGTGAAAQNGDGLLGPAAALGAIFGMAYTANGIVLISDQTNHAVRALALNTSGYDGRLTRVAGTYVSGFNGDFGDSRQSQLTAPMGIAVDAQGGTYIAETGRVRYAGGPSPSSTSTPTPSATFSPNSIGVTDLTRIVGQRPWITNKYGSGETVYVAVALNPADHSQVNLWEPAE